jgi:aminomethyltransferase
VLEVSGGERTRWLNGQLTNDATSLRPGEGCLAAVLDPKGHLLTDLVAYAAEECFWLDLPRDRAMAVHQVLGRRIIADDVALHNRTAQVARLMLVGPAAAEILAAAGAAEAPGLARWQHRRTRVSEIPATVAATGWLGSGGFAVSVALDVAEPVWDALLAAGGPRGLRPVGMRALEWLRVEAGWPWYGVDADESCLLMEALTRDYVSFTKGCYTGQEVVTRIEHQGHVNRKLTGLLVAGPAVPPAGTPLFAGDRRVGSITSAVASPSLGRVIALGYVRREQLAPGSRLRASTEPDPVEVEVTALPFPR